MEGIFGLALKIKTETEERGREEGGKKEEGERDKKKEGGEREGDSKMTANTT